VRASAESSSNSAARRPSRSRAGILLLVAVAALGAGVRLLNLRDQVLVGDERWDVLAALHLPLSEILTGFVYSRASYSPPLAAFFHLMAQNGVELSELELRAPALLCGLLAIVAIPMAARRWIGQPATGVLALLIALSPALVWYSRIVRVYMPLVLVTTLAMLAFMHWLETRSRRAASLYVLLAALSAYLHLLSLPFVVAPFLYQGLALLGRREWEVSVWLRTAALGVALACALALVLVPSAESLAWLLARTTDPERPSLTALSMAAMRLSGTYSIALAVVFYAAAARGLAVLAREQPGFAGFGVLLVCAQLIFVLGVVVPPGLREPVLTTRYVLVILPLLLTWVAVGLTRSFAMLAGRARLLQPMLVVGLLTAWVATGPLASAEYRESSFAHVVMHRPWGARPKRPPIAVASGFYARLREPALAGPVIEASWQDIAFQQIAPSHQRAHGNRVIVASPLDAWWADPRLDLRSAVGLSPQELLASEGRHVVVHLQPVAEEWEVRGRDPRYRKILAAATNFTKNYEHAQRALAAELERSFGAPDHADEWIRVWDLERLRRGR
jgi:hypothetical protein